MTAPTLDHAEPIGPQPEPAGGGLRPAVREMVAELDVYYKGADCPSIRKTAAAMKEHSTKPESWGSVGMVTDAVKAYRARHGIRPPAKKPARTAPSKPRRTAAVRPKPAAPVPPVVQAPAVQQPVPTPPPVVQTQPVPTAVTAGRTSAVRRQGRAWPLVIALPAMVAIWGGWVGLGKLTGFGEVNLLPGIIDDGGWSTIDSAITLPVGMEAYAAFALRVWLSGQVPARARRFARWSAFGSLAVGSLGQIAYHQLVAAGVTSAPWWITTIVACLPVGVLGMAAALYHLVNTEEA